MKILLNLLADGSTAYGLFVDMRGLVVADANSDSSVKYGYGEDNYGHKYTASFMGGPVGIGTQVPKYPLHVVGLWRSFAGLGTSASTLVFRDYQYGLIGLNVINESSPSTEHKALMVAPGSSTEAEGPGRVGIGVNTTMMMQDTATLIVNGDTRVGGITTIPTAPSDDDICLDGYSVNMGSKLFFFEDQDFLGV